MYSLNIQNDIIYFRDIKPSDLPMILNWYNKVDDFKYATGIDSPISLDTMTKKYAEVAICSAEFFVGIYVKTSGKMIGIIKGSLRYRNRNAVWISSIVIDTCFQKNGYGSASIELLLNHLKAVNRIKGVYLAVVEENQPGRNFWLKLGFQPLRRIENHLRLQDKKRNIIIMYRKIENIKNIM